MLEASFAAFSVGHSSSPVSTTPSGECNAIPNRELKGKSLDFTVLFHALPLKNLTAETVRPVRYYDSC